jgi:chromosome segregation ATPase
MEIDLELHIISSQQNSYDTTNSSIYNFISHAEEHHNALCKLQGACYAFENLVELQNYVTENGITEELKQLLGDVCDSFSTEGLFDSIKNALIKIKDFIINLFKSFFGWFNSSSKLDDELNKSTNEVTQRIEEHKQLLKDLQQHNEDIAQKMEITYQDIGRLGDQYAEQYKRYKESIDSCRKHIAAIRNKDPKFANELADSLEAISVSKFQVFIGNDGVHNAITKLYENVCTGEFEADLTGPDVSKGMCVVDVRNIDELVGALKTTRNNMLAFSSIRKALEHKQRVLIKQIDNLAKELNKSTPDNNRTEILRNMNNNAKCLGVILSEIRTIRSMYIASIRCLTGMLKKYITVINKEAKQS